MEKQKKKQSGTCWYCIGFMFLLNALVVRVVAISTLLRSLSSDQILNEWLSTSFNFIAFVKNPLIEIDQERRAD